MHGARLMDKPLVDGGVVANQFANTNKLVEVQSMVGNLGEFLGKPYQGYEYAYDINEIESNRLFQADIVVTSDAPGKPVVSKMSVLFFRPLSAPGHLDSGYMHQ